MTALNFNARELGEEALRRLELAERLDALARIAGKDRRDGRIFIKDVNVPIDADLPRDVGWRGDKFCGEYVRGADVAESARRHRSMAESLTTLARIAATVEGNEATSQRQAETAATAEQPVADTTDGRDGVDGSTAAAAQAESDDGRDDADEA